ncbi:MAG: Holliday junction resolvase RuvX [Phycisphaeraceae bacterium]|nr:Holliday junction resolvase RuvX [Phycisphaeraceae bacterium]
MRYLALDIGAKRTGVAAGDDVVRLVQPLTVLQAPIGPPLLHALATLLCEHAPDALVVGLPLNMDGSEGPAAKSIQELARDLAAKFSLPVHLQDERLTSSEADARMARSGRTHGQKKALRDALAAAAILEDFLRREPGP